MSYFTLLLAPNFTNVRLEFSAIAYLPSYLQFGQKHMRKG